jgi:hypothetical protein
VNPAQKRREPPARLFQSAVAARFIAKLGLCFPNTKTSKAMAFLKVLKNGVSPARRAHVMAGMYLKSKKKFPQAPNVTTCFPQLMKKYR